MGFAALYPSYALRSRRLLCPSTFTRRHRDDHRDAAAILDIGLAMEGDEIALFQHDADQDVSGRRYGKQEMTRCHHGRRPERQDEAEIDRMADEFVEQGRLEARMLGHPALPMR